VQPFFGTIWPILIVSDIRLESIYLIVGSSKLIARGSKLIRQFMSHVSCLLEFSLISRVSNKFKNSAPCPVEYIGFRPHNFLFRSIWDNGSDSGHGTLPTQSKVTRPRSSVMLDKIRKQFGGSWGRRRVIEIGRW
jgi:hypothetical protein